jgi:hypothetical protein
MNYALPSPSVDNRVFYAIGVAHLIGRKCGAKNVIFIVREIQTSQPHGPCAGFVTLTRLPRKNT